MKKRNKTLLKTIIPTLLLSVATSCTNMKTKLIVWTFTDELKNMINEHYIPNVKPKYDVEIYIYELNSMKQKLSLALQTGKNVPDVVALEAAVVQSFTELDYLADLSSIIDSGVTKDMYQYTIDVATNAKNETVGLSWQATPGGFFYKRSVAEKLGINSPNEMQARISSWDRYLDLAEQAKREDIYISSSITDSIKVFLSERSNPWVVDNELVLDDVMFFDDINCYDIVYKMQQNKYTHETVERSTGWFSDISSTKVLGYFASSWGLYYDLQENAKTTYGDWAMCAGPSSFYNGGTWLSAIKTSKNIDAAKDLITYLTTNDSFLSTWGEKTGDFMNNKQVMTQLKTHYSSEFLSGQNHLDILFDVAESINGSLISPYDSIVNGVYTSFVGDYALQKPAISKSTSIQQFITTIGSTLPDLKLPEF